MDIQYTQRDFIRALAHEDFDMNQLLQVVAVIWLRRCLEVHPNLESDDPAEIKEGREWKKKIEALHTLIDNPKLVKRAWQECG